MRRDAGTVPKESVKSRILAEVSVGSGVVNWGRECRWEVELLLKVLRAAEKLLLPPELLNLCNTFMNLLYILGSSN